jgi:hypothetical protein
LAATKPNRIRNRAEPPPSILRDPDLVERVQTMMVEAA